MVRNLIDEAWSKTNDTADMLSPLTDIAEAPTKAFSSKITAIKPTSSKFNIFNEINYGGQLYIIRGSP